MSEQDKETEHNFAKMSDDDTDEHTANVKPDTLADIPIDSLKTFANHPYKLLPAKELLKLANSIKEDGLHERIIVRLILGKDGEDNYHEILSGHNRVAASRMIGKASIPAIIKNVDDIAAARIVVISNSHRRKEWLPSEYGRAFSLLLKDGNRMGKRPEQSSEEEYQKTTREEIAHQFAKKGSFVQQHVRLTKLVDELLERVDNKQIAVSAGEQVSYLNVNEQKTLAKILADSEPNVELKIKSAKELKEASKKSENIRGLDANEIIKILKNGMNKPPTKLEIPFDSIKQYFKSDDLPEEEMVETIVKAMDMYSKATANSSAANVST